MKFFYFFVYGLFLLSTPGFSATSKINNADTAWVLISSALVMLMTPALAFFYGGMIRRKNVLGVLMKSFMALTILFIEWILIGYSLSFSKGNAFIGGLSWVCLKNVGISPYSPYAGTIPHMAFMIFQAMFAIITPALIIGAFVERIKFPSYLSFIVLWSLFVYYPVTHWVWGEDGFLAKLGIMDFAGGIVVHTTAGVSALIMAILIGRRKIHTFSPLPHNLPFTVLGTGLLWFGWFGFNAGSALSANGIAVNAFVTTNTSATAAGLTWAILEWKFSGKPTMLGTATGIIAGLATITPASGFVGVIPALLIGILASIVCYIAVSVLKPKFNYDDSLDVFGVHGVGGMLGTILTGIFASNLINNSASNGLFYGGNIKTFLMQIGGVLLVGVYTLIVTFILYKLIDAVIGVRISFKEEILGIDLSEHNERAYTLIE